MEERRRRVHEEGCCAVHVCAGIAVLVCADSVRTTSVSLVQQKESLLLSFEVCAAAEFRGNIHQQRGHSKDESESGAGSTLSARTPSVATVVRTANTGLIDPGMAYIHTAE
jgi:hypothetical protein